MKVIDAIQLCKLFRKSVSLSKSFTKGLEKLEYLQNEKKLKRLRNRMRNSSSISIAF